MNKFSYYLKNILRQAIPSKFYQLSLRKKLQSGDKNPILNRVNYYNKLSKITPVAGSAIQLGSLKIFESPKAYNFDTYEYTRFFNKRLKANFLFGDIIHIPTEPSIQKSRPIAGDNANAVLLKLDKKRHFLFLKDGLPFSQKKNMLIGRASVTQPHRIRFMEMFFDHPLCDLGQVNKNGGNPAWLKPKMNIPGHLDYKFILSLEGNDVATNLKWIMSSNSIAVMPKPKYETWFMEGTLKPGVHYIEINDDYSDLTEKLEYYIAHEAEAMAIVQNAHAYVKQFQNKKKEDLISLLVLDKYFYYTGQIKEKAV